MPPEEEDDSVRGEVAEVMTVILPWGIALLVHVVIVVLALVFAWATITILEEEENIIPIATLSDNPGAPLSMKQTQKVQEQATSQQRQISKVKTETVSNQVTKTTDAPKLIGVMGGEAGKSSPFGTLSGVGGPFKASFYGTGGNARRLAFVIDASGSLIDTLPFVINELKTRINKLSERQSFTVIFFSDGRVIEPPRRGLLQATAQNRKLVMDWLDSGAVEAHGAGSPVAAIRKALNYRPQLVFLLSDNITGRGRYELDQQAFLKEMASANKSGTKINAIQFITPDPLEKAGLRATLRELADQSGGLYKFVDESELGL